MTRSLRKCTPLAFAFALLLAACPDGDGDGPVTIPSGIRVSQVGYAPDAEKLAVVVGGEATTFNVVDTATSLPVGAVDRPLGAASTFALSGESVRVADFSDVTAGGTYRIEVPGLDPSHDFEIRTDVFRDPALKTLKAFYFWRASTAIDETHGGAWHWAAGHPNLDLPFHATAAAHKHTTADSWDAPGGWYDAGDYGQYVVNAGITVGTLLALHELLPGAIVDDTNIPESGNGVSDLLDEVRVELEWMLAMQDTDGGVFFKLSGAGWPGWVLPAADGQTRYVVGKSTTSALDFAAVMAIAARLYGEDPPVGAGDTTFATQCEQAAIAAYGWALANPDIAHPSDDTGSGPYGDDTYTDEFTWAAAELYATTGNADYLGEVALTTVSLDDFAHWQGVKNLAYYSLLASGALDETAADTVLAALFAKADEHVAAITGNAYGFPLDGYQWGSASQVANVGVMLVYAAYFSSDQASIEKYRGAAIQTAEYVLGKNSTGYSFVTGVGDKTPMHVHHRQSQADGVTAPVPGLLTGGPNSALQDLHDGQAVTYPRTCSSERPAFCYTDQLESYSSNEPAINQQAAAVFLFTSLDALLDF